MCKVVITSDKEEMITGVFLVEDEQVTRVAIREDLLGQNFRFDNRVDVTPNENQTPEVLEELFNEIMNEEGSCLVEVDANCINTIGVVYNEDD